MDLNDQDPIIKVEEVEKSEIKKDESSQEPQGISLGFEIHHRKIRILYTFKCHNHFILKMNRF
jgi:hypothetical protein